MIAAPGLAAGNDDSISAIFESAHEVKVIDAPGAGHFDDVEAHRGRGAGVVAERLDRGRCMGTAEGDDPRFRERPSSGTSGREAVGTEQCANLRKDIAVGEQGHADGAGGTSGGAKTATGTIVSIDYGGANDAADADGITVDCGGAVGTGPHTSQAGDANALVDDRQRSFRRDDGAITVRRRKIKHNFL